MPNLIDYAFLSAREGGCRLDGYVPNPGGAKVTSRSPRGSTSASAGGRNLLHSGFRIV